MKKKIKYGIAVLLMMILFLCAGQPSGAASKKGNFKPVIKKQEMNDSKGLYPYDSSSDYRVYKITGYNNNTKKKQDYEYYYTLDGSTPNKKSQRYYHSITLKTGKNYTLKVTAYDGNQKGKTVTKKINLKKIKMTKKGKVFWKLYDKYITPEMTDFERLVVVQHWRSKNMTYDIKYEDKPPIETGKGECVSFSRAYRYLAQGMGVECGIITGTLNGEGHAWNYAIVEGYYYELEPQDVNLKLYTEAPASYKSARTEKKRFKKCDKPIEELYTEFYISPLMEELGYGYRIQSFKNCKKLVFREGCKTAGYGYDADNKKQDITDSLVEIVLPKSVKEITGFVGAKKLKYINLENVETISGSFEGCSALTSVNLASLKKVEGGTFAGCTSLKEVELPKLKEVEGYTFFGCTSLEKVELPKELKNISVNMFGQCTSLKSIEIPQSVEEIGEEAFAGCSSLSEVNLPNSVKVIRGYAFANTNIQTVVIPGSVEQMEEEVFSPSLKRVNFEENGTRDSLVIDGTFWNSSLEEITFPRDIAFEYFECSEQFTNNTKLRSVTFPEGITSIPDNLFLGCTSLTTVNLPESIEYIGQYAFRNCSSLSYIYIPQGIEDIGFLAFDGTAIPNIAVLVPEHIDYSPREDYDESWLEENGLL